MVPSHLVEGRKEKVTALPQRVMLMEEARVHECLRIRSKVMLSNTMAFPLLKQTSLSSNQNLMAQVLLESLQVK